MKVKRRSKKQAEKFRGLPCEVCGSTHTTGDHIKTIGSGGEDVDENMWPLCFFHHREKEDKSLTNFVVKYPRLRITLRDKGWTYDEFMGRWYRLTEQGWDD